MGHKGQQDLQFSSNSKPNVVKTICLKRESGSKVGGRVNIIPNTIGGKIKPNDPDLGEGQGEQQTGGRDLDLNASTVDYKPQT